MLFRSRIRLSSTRVTCSTRQTSCLRRRLRQVSSRAGGGVTGYPLPCLQASRASFRYGLISDRYPTGLPSFPLSLFFLLPSFSPFPVFPPFLFPPSLFFLLSSFWESQVPTPGRLPFFSFSVFRVQRLMTGCFFIIIFQPVSAGNQALVFLTESIAELHETVMDLCRECRDQLTACKQSSAEADSTDEKAPVSPAGAGERRYSSLLCEGYLIPSYPH